MVAAATCCPRFALIIPRRFCFSIAFATAGRIMLRSFGINANSSGAFRASKAAALVATVQRRCFSSNGSQIEKFANMFAMPNHQEPTYRKLDKLSSGVSKVDVKLPNGETKKILNVSKEALTGLAHEAMVDVNHLLRGSHLQSLAKIMKDPEASKNDKFVALELLKNACVSAGMVLPGCQDTGTAAVIAKKGEQVWAEVPDEEALSQGIYDAYTQSNLRYSQMAPLDMFEEVNTKCNLPAQLDIGAVPGDEYKFLFIAKGGGSANKTNLFQQTKALLTPEKLMKFFEETLPTLGTAACPPYHLAVVIGGLSADQTLKTVKLATTRYLDGLPTSGSTEGRAFRDLEWEQKLTELANTIGIGAQFGGKYFCHDVRVVRLPRHGASCPVGLGVSCSADRQILGKINEEGVFLEQLEADPAKYLPDISQEDTSGTAVVNVNLRRPIKEVCAELSKYPVSTRVTLTGTLIVARDMAHQKLEEQLKATGSLPEYTKQHPIYYAGRCAAGGGARLAAWDGMRE
eukprot:GHVU01097671.1.p1 GENE.GHVU01097671.1~~GHVU01097671.1.p1  ORF type:complete len:516 (+),score=114.25 GHVU01097671.1:152-1699(+)